MAYYTLHAYDADVRIPYFAGIRQDSEIASDLRFAMEAENVETPNGVLQPQAGLTEMSSTRYRTVYDEEEEEYVQIIEPFEEKIETIATFHRRWYAGTGSKDWYICCAGGRFYYKQAGDNSPWTEIPCPEFTEEGQKVFKCSVWSWVTYQDEGPVDVLLMTNALDGMIMVTPPDRPNTWDDVDNHTWEYWEDKTLQEMKSASWNIEPVETPKNFGVIERHAERIWGGAIPDDPDMVVWSAVYDPTDWNAYPYPDASDPDEGKENPEDGAGDNQIPSWDGDSVNALKRFGEYLLVFKKNKVWRVTGVSPGEFSFQEQYGGGTEFFNTIAVDKERVFMAAKDGINIYDGMTVTPFNRPMIEKFWRTVNQSAMDQMCAVIHKHKYYLAVPTGNSTVNNALLVYDTENGTFLTYTDIYIESMVSNGEHMFVTTSTVPGKIFEMNYDSWETGISSGKGAKWETPWMDFNYMTIAKGGYEVYFVPEVRKYPVTFRFSIQTEKKTKSKTVIIQPTIGKAKQKKIKFGGASRRFKLIIEALPIPNGAIWRLTGGIHMVVETDPD